MRISKIIAFVCAALCLASCSKPQVRMTFDGFTNDTVILFSIPVEMLSTATDDSATTIDTLLIKDGRIEIDSRDEAMSYIFTFKETDDYSHNFSRRSIEFIAMPEDKIGRAHV